MTSGMRVAALFLAYGAIGAGGEYAVSLFAQDAGPEFRFEHDVRVDVDVVVDVDPDIQVDIQIRHTSQCSFALDRELTLPTSLANQLVIRAGAGELNVEGRQGLDEVRVVASVCASNEEYLDDLTVTLEQSGTDVILSTHYPERRNNWRGNNTARIDLLIEMPLGMDVDIDDSSGSMDVRGTGDLRIDDSSGSIRVSGANGSVYVDDSSGDISGRDVAGDVDIEDGSSSIEVIDVQGSVRIEDGSGNIDIREVDQNVVIDDGSGSIDVSNVGGDLIVEDDGNGSINYSGVEGTVDIPEDKRRRRRRRG